MKRKQTINPIILLFLGCIALYFVLNGSVLTVFRAIGHRGRGFFHKGSYMVYYTVGGSDLNYLELLRFQLSTLRSFPENDNIDVYVLADTPFAEVADQKAMFPFNVSVVAHDMNLENCTKPPKVCAIVYSSMRKTLVFDLVPNMSRYDAVLFLDSDVVITGSLQPVFDRIMKDKGLLHVKNDYTTGFGTYDIRSHGHYYWSNKDYSPLEMHTLETRVVPVFNAGQFGFCPTKEMELHFGELNQQIRRHGKRSHFYEQSHMNRYFNPRVLTKVSLRGLVGGRFETAIKYPIIHHKNARMSFRQKLSNMQRSWKETMPYYRPRRHLSRYSLHRFLAPSSIVVVGVPDSKFASYLLRKFAPTSLFVVDVKDRRPLYQELTKAAKKAPALHFVNSESLYALKSGAINGELADLVFLNFNESVALKDVEKGLRTASSLLQSGGWLAGSAYGCGSSGAEAVATVNKFCERHGVRIWHTFRGKCPGFAIRLK